MTNPYGFQRWQGLIQYMNSEDWTNKIPMLQDYISVMDQQRGTDFKSVFPELSNLL